MGFERYSGNARTVEALRRSIMEGRLPHALALAGPVGVGKYTLATMVARAVNCLDEEARKSGDFCGRCESCRQIGQLESYEDHPEFGRIVADRARASAEDRRENPLVLSTHPDVFVFPPDGKAQLISIHQVRRMTSLAQYRPSRARMRVFILDGADRIDEVAANAMLKTLEEPPADTLLILTAVSYFELLPTIRSRVFPLLMGSLESSDVEALLSALDWSAAEKRLAARLSEGRPGVARRLDLAESKRLRGELLGLLRDGLEARNYSSLFARTQSLAQAKDERLEDLLGSLYGLLQDLMYLVAARESGVTPRPLRNVDLEKDIAALATRVDWSWLVRAALRLDELDSLLRRNINRQIALEALAVSLGRGRA